MKSIAVIPARSGSKGVPNKNIKKLGDIPLFGWGIKAILASKNIKKIILSTDSEEYYNIAKLIDSNILWHKRTPELAEDVPTELVLLDILKKMKSEFENIELIVLVQPTTPFVTSYDIDKCVDMINENHQFNSCISVKAISEYPEWMISSNDGKVGNSKNLSGDIGIRQNLKKRWIPNGGIYVIKKEFLEKEKKIIDEKNTLIHKMSKISSLDIDDFDDFEICQAIVKMNLMKPED